MQIRLNRCSSALLEGQPCSRAKAAIPRAARLLELALSMSAAGAVAAPRPRIGVGVFVTHPARPGHILLGQRKGSAGCGTWALPGGHLEYGESWEECGAREVLEETGLEVSEMRTATVTNVVDPPNEYHYVVIFMKCVALGSGDATNMEPDKCEGWRWVAWDAELPTPLFSTLSHLRSAGFDPFRHSGELGPKYSSPPAYNSAPSVSTALPPYVCAILRDAETGELLVEQRPHQAGLAAAGKLTCFGGKREADEAPMDCLLRELREELGGWEPMETPRRVVDLYVEGALIAWFYLAAAPSHRSELTFERGRDGVWYRLAELLEKPTLSEWHAVVLRAFRDGHARADFYAPSDSPS